MKNFSHIWENDIFLLHIQLNNNSGKNTKAILTRKYNNRNANNEQEVINVDKDIKSHRFIVSRTHPEEIGFEIEYSDDIVLQAFKIYDRAYYPTEAFYTA